MSGSSPQFRPCRWLGPHGQTEQWRLRLPEGLPCARPGGHKEGHSDTPAPECWGRAGFLANSSTEAPRPSGTAPGALMWREGKGGCGVSSPPLLLPCQHAHSPFCLEVPTITTRSPTTTAQTPVSAARATPPVLRLWSQLLLPRRVFLS